MMRFFVCLLLMIAVSWSIFATGGSVVYAFNTEAAIERTVSLGDRINPVNFFATFAGSIKTDADLAVSGFSALSEADNVLEVVKSLAHALGMFFKYGFMLVLDVIVSPTIFTVDVLVSVYNIIAVWTGLPVLNIWLEPLGSYVPVASEFIGGGRDGR